VGADGKTKRSWIKAHVSHRFRRHYHLFGCGQIFSPEELLKRLFIRVVELGGWGLSSRSESDGKPGGLPLVPAMILALETFRLFRLTI
jgi:hypothetical protein